MISVVPVPFDDARAHALWDEQQAELAERYGEPDIHPTLSPDGAIGSLIAIDGEGEVVGTVLARWSPYHRDAPGTAEVKRLYVAPEHRGNGYARVLMGALERVMARAGVTRIVLETGTLQPEAISVYRGIGYGDIANFGPYKDEPASVCLGKSVPTRVLVINGTMGAGKTTTAAAVHDVWRDAGARSAYIDADALCQAAPTLDEDPFNQELLFAALAAVAPLYRARGMGCVVIARVVEDAGDRDRYARAFASEAGLAQVAVVRVTADESTRLERVRAREPEGYWQELGLARTVELEDTLEALDLDDAVISTDDRDRLDVARDALDAAGW